MNPAVTPRTHLNAAGTSFPKPEAVHRAVAQTLQAPPHAWGSIFDEAATFVARHLNVKTERLLFTSSCTQALDLAISELEWHEGDAIVTSHLEHRALLRPIQGLERSRGVQHLRAPYQPGMPFDLAYLSRVLESGKVRLVAVSAASNVTGEILPLVEIARRAHEHDALVLGDLAQTFGLLPDTPRRLGLDLAAFAGHKNPLGPQGIGGLWAREGVPFETESVQCALEQGSARCSPMPGYCEAGGVNVAGLAGLAAGLTAFGAERPARMLGARRLAAELAQRARRLAGVSVLGHHGGPQTAVVSLRHARLPIDAAAAHFSRHGLSIRAGSHCAPDALEAVGARHGTIRVSFGPNNTERDLDAACEALASAGTS